MSKSMLDAQCDRVYHNRDLSYEGTDANDQQLYEASMQHQAHTIDLDALDGDALAALARRVNAKMAERNLAGDGLASVMAQLRRHARGRLAMLTCELTSHRGGKVETEYTVCIGDAMEFGPSLNKCVAVVVAKS